MKPGKLRIFLLPVMAITVLVGCASAPVSYEVRDGAGNLVVSQAVEIDRPETALQAVQSALMEADYSRCRALALLVQDAWPQDRKVSAEARRAAAWCLLFNYESSPGSLSALENEAWNLDILDAALDEFRQLPRTWPDEVSVLERAVEERMRHLAAFDATIAGLRAASRTGSADARALEISDVRQRYPEWSAAIDLKLLSSFPWSVAESQR